MRTYITPPYEPSDGTFGYGYDHSYCLVFQQTES